MKKIELKSVCAALAAALLFGCQHRECVTGTPSGTSFAEEVFAPAVEKGELPGAINVFYDNGRVECSCVGYSDLETKRPIGLDDVFMQCSQTKGFCGVTVAMLVEDGKISLDDPVSKYLPEFKTLWVTKSDTNGVRVVEKAENALTVRMCLNHTGGLPFELPNFQSMGGWSRRMPLRSAAATAAAVPLLFEPGTKMKYSNLGIDIAAAVVETVSGMRWEDFLQRRLFGPLGMTRSVFRPSQEDLAGRIRLYRVFTDGRKPEAVDDNPNMQRPFSDDRVFPSAGAGLWTTARDQLRFYKMLMNLGVGENGVRVMKEETVRSILARSTAPKGWYGYSLGMVAPEKDKDTDDAWFGHGGAWVSKCMVNYHRKQLKLLVVQLVGGNCYRFRDLSDKAADRFFKTKIDNSGTNAFTGRLK
ncbi:MAG: beta-lactamase family protein [Kiritimatiellae bacterium]|nr:beta-lactamase family protein [Kiritimatiellia bacterium]